MSKHYSCPYCGKLCKTQRGVTQHINQSPSCLSKQELQVSGKKRSNPESNDTNPAPDDTDSHDKDDTDSLLEPPRRSSRLRHLNDTQPKPIKVNKVTRPTGPLVASLPPPDTEMNAEDAFPADDDAFPVDSEEPPIRKVPSRNYKTTGEDDEGSTDTSGTSTSDLVAQPDLKRPPPNTKLLLEFRTYCDTHYDNFFQLTKEQKTCIRLMQVLKKKAPLSAYEDVLEWHLKESGALHRHETLGALEAYPRRQTLISTLIPRYNLKGLETTMKKVRLPSSKAVVSVPCRDAGACIVSLLTDPRIKDDDYFFFHDDPLAPPPETVTKLGDLNTGDAYLKTYKKLIRKPNQVLLPTCVYIDGAVTC